jgi:hypothetical protein
MSAEALQTNPSTTTGLFASRPLGRLSKYQIKFSLLLSMIPLLAGGALLLLLSAFSKLNLFFIEAHGVILGEQVREAYFQQVELEILSAAWLFLAQVGVTLVVSYVIMRWATAPFTAAEKMVETAMHRPKSLRPPPRWLSVSPRFDRYIWLFCLRVRSGGPNQIAGQEPFPGLNIFFLVKFCLAFAALTLVVGYAMGMILGSVHGKIVSIALQLVSRATVMGHYFMAQEEVLRDATYVLTSISLVLYLIIGLQLARYMANMIQVFSQALLRDEFPITLRSNDIYQGLASTLHQARQRIPK